LSSGASWPRRSPTASLDGSSSESELGDDEVSPGALLVYPIAMLLAARAAFAVGAASLSRAARGARPCSVLGYSVRAEAELPECLARTTSAPSSAAAASSVEAEAEDERILRAARSILNKLTVEKFDALYEQLATCGISTEAQLRSVVCEVFEKATAQHHFIPMYADLCVRLESEERIVIAQEAVSEAVGRSDQFRRLLLNRCQSAFEELLAPERSSAGEGEDDEARLVRKQRALGSVRLVGQLLLRGMLSSRLMVHCAQDLLEARSRCAGALEFLAAFLTVVCPAFDTPRFALHAQLQAILHRLEELAGDKASVSPRERCLLRDLLDLRAAGWAGRHSAAKPSAPMRLEAVRAEAAAEGVVASPQRPRAPLSGASSSTPSSPAWSRSPAAACGRPWQRSSHAHAGATPQATPQQQRAKARRAPGEGQAVAAAAPQCPAAGVKQASTPEAAVVSAGRGVEAATSVAPARGPFDPKAFRRVVSAAMKELAAGASVPAVVRRIREQDVPVTRQAGEFADILTRASEERRGPVRRTAFAFAAGLAAADGTSAFDRSACLEGLGLFFSEVYPDLCEEVPRLAFVVKAELVPTLRSVLPEASLRRVVSDDMFP